MDTQEKGSSEALTAAEKEALRARFRAYRRGLSEAEYHARSAAIVARTRALPELVAATTVHCYWPMTQRREVDLRPLVAWLQAAEKQIVLPVVETFANTAGETPRMRHVRFEASDALRPNRWGIDEPTDGIGVPVEDIDVVLVPALGAGRNGHRVGHGFGYYDAFLKQVDGPAIGLVYAACLVESVPASTHDVPLTVLVTEDEVHYPTP